MQTNFNGEISSGGDMTCGLNIIDHCPIGIKSKPEFEQLANEYIETSCFRRSLMSKAILSSELHPCIEFFGCISHISNLEIRLLEIRSVSLITSAFRPLLPAINH